MVANSAALKSPKRTMFAFDLEPKWAEALREVVEEYFPLESSPTAFVRKLVKQAVACAIKEKALKDRGLIPFYEAAPRPDILIFLIGQAEKLRRENGPGGKSREG